MIYEEKGLESVASEPQVFPESDDSDDKTTHTVFWALSSCQLLCIPFNLSNHPEGGHYHQSGMGDMVSEAEITGWRSHKLVRGEASIRT